jgi:hypothetical protein
MLIKFLKRTAALGLLVLEPLFFRTFNKAPEKPASQD